MAKEDDEFFNDRTGEGLAMGFMALGDALGGAHGGKSDFLGSYVKMKEARRKREADAKKLSPQYLLNQIKYLDSKKRTKKEEALNKSGPESSAWYNNRLKDKGFKKFVDDYATLNRGSLEGKPANSIRTIYNAYLLKGLAALKPKPIKPRVVRPGDKPLTKADYQNKYDMLSDVNKAKMGGWGYWEGKSQNTLNKHISQLGSITRVADQDSRDKKAEEWKKIQRDRWDKDDFGKRMEKARKNMKGVTAWKNERRTLNKSLFDSLYDQLDGNVLSGFSLHDLVSFDGKIYYDPRVEGYGKVEVKLPGFYGASGWSPDVLQKYLGTKRPGQTGFENVLQKMLNAQLKDLSGAAVSADEYKRFLDGFSMGRYSDAASLLVALKDFDTGLQDKATNAFENLRRTYSTNPKRLSEINGSNFAPENTFKAYGYETDKDFGYEQNLRMENKPWRYYNDRGVEQRSKKGLFGKEKDQGLNHINFNESVINSIRNRPKKTKTKSFFGDLFN